MMFNIYRTCVHTFKVDLILKKANVNIYLGHSRIMIVGRGGIFLIPLDKYKNYSLIHV